jgi:hypothetical protein
MHPVSACFFHLLFPCYVSPQIANPHATTSDSFYFVDDKLVMHNKASYSYIVEDRAQAKRSYDYLNPDKASAKVQEIRKRPVNCLESIRLRTRAIHVKFFPHFTIRI